MPIKVQSDLPAKEILENENIFVMDENRAMHQDIRPLQVCILNLMPVKQASDSGCRPESDACETGYRAAVAAGFVQHAAAG